ncbi:MAG: 50S ribosomal protein L29 [Candidatus Diapherotrites archaeon]
MTNKEAKSFRELPKEELNEKLVDLQTELAKERATVASGTRPENPGNIRKLRRNIARLKTIINEKNEVTK